MHEGATREKSRKNTRGGPRVQGLVWVRVMVLEREVSELWLKNQWDATVSRRVG